jgi:hypothetical protein
MDDHVVSAQGGNGARRATEGRAQHTVGRCLSVCLSAPAPGEGPLTLRYTPLHYATLLGGAHGSDLPGPPGGAAQEASCQPGEQQGQAPCPSPAPPRPRHQRSGHTAVTIRSGHTAVTRRSGRTAVTRREGRPPPGCPLGAAGRNAVAVRRRCAGDPAGPKRPTRRPGPAVPKVRPSPTPGRRGHKVHACCVFGPPCAVKQLLMPPPPGTHIPLTLRPCAHTLRPLAWDGGY